MQELMDPSRNMSKYRTMLNAHIAQPPVVRSAIFTLLCSVLVLVFSQHFNTIFGRASRTLRGAT